MKKAFFVLFTLGIAALTGLTACSGLGGVSEGSACGGSTDDCAANLTCQPIKGHGSVCCPAPASASDNPSCHAAP
jgi:hypothetical protein